VTRRLDQEDSSLLAFDAEVIEVDAGGLRVVLDRTAFHPTGGGQPHDAGTLAGVRVVDVIDEETRVVHVLAEPLPRDSKTVHGDVDAARRRDHTQQHSGQHILSAILADAFARPTVSFHLGAAHATIDLAGEPLAAAHFADVETRVFSAITANLPVRARVCEGPVPGLRKPSERGGPLRVVTIEGLDVNACGGTHVASTGELGLVLLLGVEKVRAHTRLSFVVGDRALAHARRNASLLADMSAAWGSDPTQAVGAAIRQRALLAERERRIDALEAELGALEGAALHAATPEDGAGRRVLVREVEGPLDARLRATVDAFAAQPRALALVGSRSTRALLVAASPDCGLDAGATLKSQLGQVGGRGGGNATRAQGSAPDDARFELVMRGLRAALSLP
jgi:alanyl-tRNA synthetase